MQLYKKGIFYAVIGKLKSSGVFLFPIVLNFRERVLTNGGVFLETNLKCVNALFYGQQGNKPTISLSGGNLIFDAYSGTYIDSGSTAKSALWGDITSNITTTNEVPLNVAGLHYIKYNVMDSLGLNAVEVKREVYAIGWFANKYKERIVANGGVTECLRTIDEDFGKYNWEFYYKVLAEGGTIDPTTLECSQELTKNFNYDFLHRVETDFGIVERIECVII